MYRGRTPKMAQQTVTATKAVVTSVGSIVSVVLQNDPASAQNVLLGDATNQYIKLEAGKSIAFTIEDVSRLYVKTAAATATLNILGIR